VRRAVLIKPTRPIEVVRVDYERISLPMANCVSVPARLRVFARQFSAIGPYVAPSAVRLEELNHFLGTVSKSHAAWRGVPHHTGETHGIAPADRIVPVFLVRVRSVA